MCSVEFTCCEEHVSEVPRKDEHMGAHSVGRSALVVVLLGFVPAKVLADQPQVISATALQYCARLRCTSGNNQVREYKGVLVPFTGGPIKMQNDDQPCACTSAEDLAAETISAAVRQGIATAFAESYSEVSKKNSEAFLTITKELSQQRQATDEQIKLLVRLLEATARVPFPKVSVAEDKSRPSTAPPAGQKTPGTVAPKRNP